MNMHFQNSPTLSNGTFDIGENPKVKEIVKFTDLVVGQNYEIETFKGETIALRPTKLTETKTEGVIFKLHNASSKNSDVELGEFQSKEIKKAYTSYASPEIYSQQSINT